MPAFPGVYSYPRLVISLHMSSLVNHLSGSRAIVARAIVAQVPRGGDGSFCTTTGLLAGCAVAVIAPRSVSPKLVVAPFVCICFLWPAMYPAFFICDRKFAHDRPCSRRAGEQWMMVFLSGA